MENVMSSPESRLKPDHKIQLSDTASGVQPAGSESKQGPNTTTSSKAESLLAAEKRRLEMTPNEQNKAQSTSYFGCGKANTEVIGTVMDVTEHELLTQELRRREAYLAEAQKLSHTGSFGWKPDAGEIVWSDET